MQQIHDDDSEAMTEEVELNLWHCHRLENDSAARERLINYYLPYARIIAAKIYAGRHHDQFEFDEYLQFATVGMIESLDRFEPDRGAKFKTYASRRMIGAILNGLEFLSEKQQQIALRQRLTADRIESLKDVAKPSGLDPEHLFRYLADVGIGMALGYLLEGTGLVDSGEPRVVARHYDNLEIKQLQRRLQDILKTLPEREQKIIRYHYLQDVPFQEIAEILGVTKGRISQIHKRALELLRSEMLTSQKCDVAW